MSNYFENRPKPVVLAILDGWGEVAEHEHNAIYQANTPCFDWLKQNFPNTLINASELHVGLPSGQMGNSEVGHMNIGAGRVVMQDLPRIDEAIKNGALAKNTELAEFIQKIKASGGACHLLGLVSDGGVHSHIDHLIYVANILAESGLEIHIHACLDGRDTSPKSALLYLEKLKKELHANVVVSCIAGRYYAMDRDKRYERIEKFYDAAVSAKAEIFSSPEEYILQSYKKNVTDEFIIPAIAENYKGMKDGDGLLCVNFRADRVRQILSALVDDEFSEFSRKKQVVFSATLGMCYYSDALDKLVPSLFKPQVLNDIFGEIVARNGLKQLRIAETEKYAHVTFFFNGGREEPFAEEKRILIPSPKVATYDLKPEMSAFEVANSIVQAITEKSFDIVIVNFANTDMVGHSGNLQAAIKAVEAVDSCLKKISDVVLKNGGAMLITADHGNAECMYDNMTQQPHTAHTLHLVPAILVANELKGKVMENKTGKLADIAPTLLEILGLKQPAAMTGTSLLRLLEK